MCDNILTLLKTTSVKICNPHKCSKTLGAAIHDFCICNGNPCSLKRILVTFSTPESLCEFKIDNDNDPATKIIELNKMMCLNITSMVQFIKLIIGVNEYKFNIYSCDENNVTTQIYSRDNSTLECSVIKLLSEKGLKKCGSTLYVTGLFMMSNLLFMIVFQSKESFRMMHIMSIPLCYCSDTLKYDSEKLRIHQSYDIYKLSLLNNICEKRAKNMTPMNVTLGPQNDLYVLTSYGNGGYVWKIDYFLNLASYGIHMKLASSKLSCKPRTITYVNNKIIVLTNPDKCGKEITMYQLEF